MNTNRQTGIVVITRGMAPAVTIAHVVDMAHRYRAPYKLICGLPAVDAKNAAVQWAIDAGYDLLLVEDDIAADAEVWEKAMRSHSRSSTDNDIGVATCLLRNGELNTWFHGDRFCFSGSVFMRIPLEKMKHLRSSGLLFVPMRMEFSDEEEQFKSSEMNSDGTGSDVYFWSRVWGEGWRVEVYGAVTHFIHEFNNTHPRLSEPNLIKPLGVVVAKKMKIKTKEKESCLMQM